MRAIGIACGVGLAAATLGLAVVFATAGCDGHAAGGSGDAGAGRTGGESGAGGAVSVPAATKSAQPSSLTQDKAEGVYVGRVSTGHDLSLLVLDNDTAWGIMHHNGYLIGLLQGTGESRDGSYSSADFRVFELVDGSGSSGLLSTGYVAGRSIQGAFSPIMGRTMSFGATTAAVTGYDYQRPATLAAIEGVWPGYFGAGYERGTLDVFASGEFRITTSRDCRLTGTALPRATGRNVYDLRMAYGPSPCALPGHTIEGIAVALTSADGTKKLLVAGVDETRDFGSIFVGLR